jgi:hypothetical protein
MPCEGLIARQDRLENRFDLGKEHEPRRRLDHRPVPLVRSQDFHDMANGIANSAVVAG